MSTDLILYDRLWLNECADGLAHQRSVLRSMKYCLQREQQRALPERKAEYEAVLAHIKELDSSLEATELAVQSYLYGAWRAAEKLQEQCRDIQIPFFSTAE